MGEWTGDLLATKRSAGVAPKMNLRKCLPSVDKAAHSGFETQKSKIGATVASEKEILSDKSFSNENEV